MEEITKNNIGKVQRPKGWEHLPGAFRRFGEAVVGLPFALIPPAVLNARMSQDYSWPVKIPRREEYELTADDLAGLYAFAVAQGFASAVRAGSIRTAYQFKRGGGLTPIDPDLWQTADPWLRFRHCDIDPANPFRDAAGTHWIWIYNDDLEAVCAKLRQWREALPMYEDMEEASQPREIEACTFQELPARVSETRHQIYISCPWFPDLGERASLFAPALAANDAPVGLIMPAGAVSDMIDAPPSDRTGAPGRPSSMHMIEGMMRERFTKKAFAQTMADEAEILAAEFNAREDCKNLARATPKTIRNNLGELYRHLKADPENKISG